MKKIIILSTLFIMSCSTSTSINNIEKTLVVGIENNQGNKNTKDLIKEIYSFPEYLVLKTNDIKNLSVKVQESDNKFTDDYKIISSDSSIVKIEDKNTVKAIKEGQVKISIFSEKDLSIVKTIPVSVKNEMNIDSIYYPKITNSSIINISDNNDIIIKLKPDESDFYKANFSSGYKASELINNSNKDFYVNNRIDRKEEIIDNKKIVTYNLYAEVFKENKLYKRFKINDEIFKRQEDDPSNVYYKVFKSLVSIDRNNNFSILYLDQDFSYKIKVFNSEGEQTAISTFYKPVLDYDTYFSFDVSENGEKYIFSRFSKPKMLTIQVYDKNLKKLYEKDINSNTLYDYSTEEHLFLSQVSINDLGEFIIAYKKGIDNIVIKKFSINDTKNSDFSFNTPRFYEISKININNNSDINIIWREESSGRNLGVKFIPNIKNNISLKVGEKYDISKNSSYLKGQYNKCISSNDYITKVNNTEIIANDTGTTIVNCFNENDYSKNISLRFNIGI